MKPAGSDAREHVEAVFHDRTADARGEREVQLWASASRCCSAGAWMTMRFDHAR